MGERKPGHTGPDLSPVTSIFFNITDTKSKPKEGSGFILLIIYLFMNLSFFLYGLTWYKSTSKVKTV